MVAAVLTSVDEGTLIAARVTYFEILQSACGILTDIDVGEFDFEQAAAPAE